MQPAIATAAPAEPKPVFTSVKNFSKACDIGTSLGWKLVYSSRIKSVKIGRSVKIPVTEIDRILRGELDLSNE